MSTVLAVPIAITPSMVQFYAKKPDHSVHEISVVVEPQDTPPPQSIAYSVSDLAGDETTLQKTDASQSTYHDRNNVGGIVLPSLEKG